MGEIKIFDPRELIVLTDKHIDILRILSDNKGHASVELAKGIKSWEPYTNTLLGELASPKFGNFDDSISINYYHLKDPLSLLHKIQDQRDPISKYLVKNDLELGNFNLHKQDLFSIMLTLSVSLNFALFDENFYNEDRFANVVLSEQAKKLISQKEIIIQKENCKKGYVHFLNRIIIADAYPDEICKTRISLIHELPRIEVNKSKHPYFINPDLRTFRIIIKSLVNRLILDKKKLEEMYTRLRIESEPYSGWYKYFIEDPSILKLIKTSQKDINYYKNRHEENMKILKCFITSDYIKVLEKKYDRSIINLDLPDISKYEFELLKLEGIEIPDPNRISELEKLNEDWKEYYNYLVNKEK